MDHKDYQVGLTKDFFWFKGKRKLTEVLLNKLNSNKKLKILDIGVGTGEDVSIIKRFGNVYAVDIDQNALEMIDQSLVIEKKIADVCDLPYEDNFFDLVVAFDVLEHIKDDKKAVSEIERVLKPEGKFVFTLPAFNFLYSSHDRYLKHFRRYNKKLVKKLFNDFEKISVGYYLFLLFLPAALQRLFTRNSKHNLNGAPKIFPFLNKMVSFVLDFENWLLSKKFCFPFGLTIYGIYKTKK